MIRRNPMDLPDYKLREDYRFSRVELQWIIDKIKPFIKIKRQDDATVSEEIQVMITLRFLASGSFQNMLAENVGISQPETSKIINQVLNVMYRFAIKEIKMPSTIEELTKVGVQL